MYTLPSPYDSTLSWAAENVSSNWGGGNVLFVSSDTLLSGFSVISRSVDGGQSAHPIVYAGGLGFADRPYYFSTILPFAGTIYYPGRAGYAGIHFGVYSRDGGDTWAESTIAVPHPEDYPNVYGNVLVRRGPRAGRLINAGHWGLSVSDDGGASFAPVPGWWARYRLAGQGMGIVAGGAPGGGDRIVASISDTQEPVFGARLLLSDDGGDTWRRGALLEGDPNGWCVEIVGLGGGSALAFMNGGHVWRSDDGAETWQFAGTVRGAFMDPSAAPGSLGRVYWASMGPDGRVYVGGAGLHPGGEAEGGWLMRTAAQLLVGGETGAPVSTPDVRIDVRPNPSSGSVTVAVTAGDAARVSVVVLDVLGREVRRLHDGPAPGQLDVAGLPAGIYVVRALVTMQDGAPMSRTMRFVVMR